MVMSGTTNFVNIPKNTLKDNSPYLLKLFVSNNYGNDTMSIGFVTNTLATQGTLTITPKTGSGSITNFTLSTSSWQHLYPLSYRFGYYLTSDFTDTPTYFSQDYSNSLSVSFVLPS